MPRQQGPRQGPRERQGVAPRSRGDANRGGEANRGSNNGNNGSNRSEAAREDRDNRGNRDTTNRNNRNIVRDDDYGNRIPPAKLNRNAGTFTAGGEINEEHDNRGNRLPPTPKALRPMDGEAEINFNVAAPAAQTVLDHDDHQPASNVGQLFPSSAGFGEVRTNRSRGNGNSRNRGTSGARSNSGNGSNRGAGANGSNANNSRRRGQPQRQQQRQGPKGASLGGGAGRQDKRR